jgi:hypothetical protein
MSAKPITHEEIVTNLINSKAVDFTAIGKALAELGPRIAMLDEPWEGFCGTMRRYVLTYKVFTGEGTPVEELGQLGNVAGELG